MTTIRVLIVCCILTIVTVFVLVTCSVARAEHHYPYLEYLGTEIIDENGVGVINNTYYLHCNDQDYSVTVQIIWSDGALQVMTIRNGCDAKWYLTGAVEEIKVIAVASSTSTVNKIYLPLVSR